MISLSYGSPLFHTEGVSSFSHWKVIQQSENVKVGLIYDVIVFFDVVVINRKT